MRYFELLIGIYDQFDEGVIYPEDYTGHVGRETKQKYNTSVLDFATNYPLEWKKRTKAQYLSQKNTNEYTEKEQNCKGCMGPCGQCEEHKPINEWQERAESDYLAQENRGEATLGDTFDVLDKIASDFGIDTTKRRILTWEDSIDAIKDERFDEIPDYLWQSIYAKLTEENNRRWAVQNGYFKGD